MRLLNFKSKINIPIFVFFACQLLAPVLTFMVPSAVAGLFCDALVLLCFFGAFLLRLRYTKIIPVLLAGACLGAFFVSAYLHAEYRYVMFETYNIWDFVFAPRTGIILMLIMTLPDDPDEIFETLKVSAIPVWLAFTIRVLLGQGLSEGTNNNHYYGYAFLFVAILYTISFFREKKTWQIVLAGISLFQVVMFASRTALLSYVVFLGMYFLLYENGRENRGKKILTIVIGVVLALFLTSDFFLQILASLVEKMGISSKIIQAIISGENQLDGGRERTYELAAKLLRENPWGLGVYWDRYYCEYAYAHNFFYEVLLDFGWLLGGLILFWLLKNIISIMRSNEKTWKLLLMLFFSLSMVRLTLSYSFWYDSNFWAMIAVILGYRHSMKEKKKREKRARAEERRRIGI